MGEGLLLAAKKTEVRAITSFKVAYYSFIRVQEVYTTNVQI